jgi:hypothetical protein
MMCFKSNLFLYKYKLELLWYLIKGYNGTIIDLYF